MNDDSQNPESKKPKLIVDDDWKERVQAEKEQLKQQQGEDASEDAQDQPAQDQTQDASGQSEAGNSDIPSASMALLISSLATQAIFALGQLADPTSQEPPKIDLVLAKHHIDMLGVLDEKTKGNLDAEEANMLETALHELRMLFVAVSNAAQ